MIHHFTLIPRIMNVVCVCVCVFSISSSIKVSRNYFLYNLCRISKFILWVWQYICLWKTSRTILGFDREIKIWYFSIMSNSILICFYSDMDIIMCLSLSLPSIWTPTCLIFLLRTMKTNTRTKIYFRYSLQNSFKGWSENRK